MESRMNRPRIASRAEWLAARKALLAKEKELTRQRDALSAELRNLPIVKMDREYFFAGPQGRTSLVDLFGQQRQLIIYHFMFDPAWEQGCKSCAHFADNIAGAIVHLTARDTAFALVSRAPLVKLEAFKRRMGWSFQWLSSADNSFNYDFQATLDPELGSNEYNYANASALLNAGKIWYPKGEMPGLSVFLRDAGEVFHSYSVYQRGLDIFLNTYNLLDVTPLGRQEGSDRTQGWIRHHDQYAA
jgi:predicted dithiol-disulfide oxidoreductase (DUF899 family)